MTPTPDAFLPALPVNTPAWVYLAIALVPVLTVLIGGIVYMMKRYADGKILELKDRLAKQKRVTDEFEEIMTKHEAGIILYIDDNVNDHILVGRTLRLIGMENKIAYCDSPGSGLKYLTEHPKSVLFVLADIKMVSNGYRILETMKLHEDLKKIPVILISGIETDAEDEVFKRGAVGFLTKPLNIFKLLSFLNYSGFSFKIER